MKPIESKYRKFPFALVLPDLMPVGHESRHIAIKEWTDALDLAFNTHYVCFEVQKRVQYRIISLHCWAFSEKWMSLQFKLKFGGWSDTNS